MSVWYGDKNVNMLNNYVDMLNKFSGFMPLVCWFVFFCTVKNIKIIILKYGEQYENFIQYEPLNNIQEYSVVSNKVCFRPKYSMFANKKILSCPYFPYIFGHNVYLIQDFSVPLEKLR